MLTTQPSDHVTALRLRLPALSYRQLLVRRGTDGWMGNKAQETKSDLGFFMFTNVLQSTRDSESGGTLNIVVASCQVRSKCVRWPGNEPTPPSAQAKNSDALGNAVERKHKNARIMPSGSFLNQYEVLLLNRLVKNLVHLREPQDERRDALK